MEKKNIKPSEGNYKNKNFP